MQSHMLNISAHPEPRYGPSLAPRPQHLFGSKDPAWSDKRIKAPARILVVEDDFLVATEIETALADAGFDIAGVAASAHEAVELAESQKPALVVMDVRLAGKRDGIHAAAEIFRKLRIGCIFATAYYDQQTRERAKPAMPLGWVQKPYSRASLVNAVRRALRELDANH